MASIAAVQTLPIKLHTGNGTLAAFEFGRNVPFVPQRVFTVSGVDGGAWRGHHAHKQCKQALVCIAGQVEVEVDDGTDKSTVTLAGPGSLLYIPPSIWASERYASASTVLMVLADRFYEEQDYLRDYQEFLRHRRL